MYNVVSLSKSVLPVVQFGATRDSESTASVVQVAKKEVYLRQTFNMRL